MKKSLQLLLVFGYTAILPAKAQREFILSLQDKKGFVNLSAGVSIPMAQFASSSASNPQACLASPGTSVNVSAGYRLLGNWGLMAKGEQHKNFYNTEALLATVTQGRIESDRWTVQAGNWLVNTIMAGPYVTQPYRRFAFDARLLVGVMQATLPSTSLEGDHGNSQYTIHTTKASSTGVTLGGGLSVRYRLGRFLSLTVAGDATRSQLMFGSIWSTAYSNASQSESTVHNSQRVISVVSVSAGISFLFGNNFRPY